MLWKKMTQKAQNHYKCHHMQCIFDPKTAKARIFSDTTLPFDDPKQLSPDSDQVLDKSDVWFQRKFLKT